MTDDQIKILKHLAGVMGWKPDPYAALHPVYFHEFEPRRTSAIVFSLDAWQGHPNPPVCWNPLEDANAALEVAEKMKADGWGIRIATIDNTEYPFWSCWIGHPGTRKQGESAKSSLNEAICLACYRATGGPEF